LFLGGEGESGKREEEMFKNEDGAKQKKKKKRFGEKNINSLSFVGKGVPRRFGPRKAVETFKHLVPAAVTGVASPPGQNCSKSVQ